MGAGPLDRQRTLRPGLSLSRDGERVDWYASVPLAAWVFVPGDEVDVPARRANIFETLLGLEAGASVHLGEVWSVRAGLTGLMPTAGVRHGRGRLYVDLHGGSLGLAHLGVLQVGWRGGARPKPPRRAGTPTAPGRHRPDIAAEPPVG